MPPKMRASRARSLLRFRFAQACSRSGRRLSIAAIIIPIPQSIITAATINTRMGKIVSMAATSAFNRRLSRTNNEAPLAGMRLEVDEIPPPMMPLYERTPEKAALRARTPRRFARQDGCRIAEGLGVRARSAAFALPLEMPP